MNRIPRHDFDMTVDEAIAFQNEHARLIQKIPLEKQRQIIENAILTGGDD